MSKVVFGLFVLSVLFSFSGCEEQSKEKGTIAGKINIGPLCPVETDPPDSGCLPTAETFKAYPVYIHASDGSQNILIKPALDGSFNVELEPGDYFVTLEKVLVVPESSNLPLAFRVNQSEKTIITIEIDTGIR